MKLLIFIVVIVLLLQFGTVAIGLSTEGDGKDEPTEEQIEEGDWNPKKKFPKTASIGNGFDWMRPKVKLHWESGTFDQADENVVVPYSRGHKKERMIRFVLTGGDGVRIRYDCSIDRDGFECPQTLCLCQQGKPIADTDYANCNNIDPPVPALCPKDNDRGEIFVFGKKGQIHVSGLGPGGGTIRQD